MHLFEGNRNIDLFNSVQLIRILSQSGEGIQSLISSISESNYGYISKQFKKIIVKSQQGESISQAIENVQKHEKNKYLKRLLNSFSIAIEQSIDLNPAIDDIEQQIIDEQKDNIDKFILHTNKMTFISLYITFIPFLYIILEIINWVFAEFQEESRPFMTDEFRLYFFVMSLGLFGLFTLLLRYPDG